MSTRVRYTHTLNAILRCWSSSSIRSAERVVSPRCFSRRPPTFWRRPRTSWLAGPVQQNAAWKKSPFVFVCSRASRLLHSSTRKNPYARVTFETRFKYFSRLFLLSARKYDQNRKYHYAREQKTSIISVLFFVLNCLKIDYNRNLRTYTHMTYRRVPSRTENASKAFSRNVHGVRYMFGRLENYRSRKKTHLRDSRAVYGREFLVQLGVDQLLFGRFQSGAQLAQRVAVCKRIFRFSPRTISVYFISMNDIL